MNAADTVLTFFESRGGLPGATVDEQLACLYLDEKILDSMGIIELVTHLESTLAIRFDAEHLQSNEFQTVGGLIRIVERLLASPA